MKNEKCFYSVPEFAAKLGVHPNTVYKAIRQGRISALRLGGSIRASYRIPFSEIDRLAIVNLEDILQKKEKGNG